MKLEPIHPLTDYTSFFIHEHDGLHVIYGRYGTGTGCEALGETRKRDEAYAAIKDFIDLIQSTRALEGLPPATFNVGFIRA